MPPPSYKNHCVKRRCSIILGFDFHKAKRLKYIFDVFCCFQNGSHLANPKELKIVSFRNSRKFALNHGFWKKGKFPLVVVVKNKNCQVL